MKKITIFKNILFSIIPFILAIVFCNTVSAKGASFYFSKTIFNEKENTATFSLNISSELSINASQSTIFFNNKDIEIVSINKNSSIFDLWIKQPRFSNTKGFIQFSGGTTNKFISKGEIFKIVFKIKNENLLNTTLEFNKSMILAANGKGTNIISDSKEKHLYFNNKENKLSLK